MASKNQQPHDCLLKRLFGRRSKKTSKLRVTDLCDGNSPVTGEFPAQRASNTENVFDWWRHHGLMVRYLSCISYVVLVLIIFNLPYTYANKHDRGILCIMIKQHRKHQSSASLAFVRGIHRRLVNSPPKMPVTRKVFPFDDVIMKWKCTFV